MSRILFDSAEKESRRAIVASFDVSGFSDWCNHPESHSFVQRFESCLFEGVDQEFQKSEKGMPFGGSSSESRLRRPDFAKFTGDGAIFIWFTPTDPAALGQLATSVVTGMRSIQRRLATTMQARAVELRARSFPHKVRVGIAIGEVFPLRPPSPVMIPSDPIDYVGYCINLAVRLQNHCPEVGFVIHEPLLPKVDGLIKLIAHNMKGSAKEPVFIFGEDLSLEWQYLRSKFEPIGDEPECRIAATIPADAAPAKLPFVQPRFEAVLTGYKGHKINQILFLDKVYPEFVPIRGVKDSSGKVIRQEKHFYRLASNGPPLRYEFVRAEELPAEKWMPPP